MNARRLLLPFLLAVAVTSFLSGCAGGPRPETPPTFVLAWTADVPQGQVWTVESNDGIVWRNATAQNLQGNSSESNAGPAIAHDGNLSWMLMWPNPRGFDYKIGTGGIALSGRGGVVWESQPQQGRLPFTALGGRPEGSPALAFGQGRWVAAFRMMATGGAISVVRSAQNSATRWEAPRPVEVRVASGIRNVSSARDPALAFGGGTFVMVHRGANGFTASTSPDGVAWTDRGTIAQIPEAEVSDPALSFSDGNFFVALRKRLTVPPPAGGGYTPSAAEIYKSPDGVTWTRIAEQAGYFSPIGKEFGPAFSFGNFGNNVCKAILVDRGVEVFPASIGPARGIQSWVGTPPPPHSCSDPSLLQFLPAASAGTEVIDRSPVYRPSLFFGRTNP